MDNIWREARRRLRAARQNTPSEGPGDRLEDRDTHATLRERKVSVRYYGNIGLGELAQWPRVTEGISYPSYQDRKIAGVSSRGTPYRAHSNVTSLRQPRVCVRDAPVRLQLTCCIPYADIGMVHESKAEAQPSLTASRDKGGEQRRPTPRLDGRRTQRLGCRTSLRFVAGRNLSLSWINFKPAAGRDLGSRWLSPPLSSLFPNGYGGNKRARHPRAACSSDAARKLAQAALCLPPSPSVPANLGCLRGKNLPGRDGAYMRMRAPLPSHVPGTLASPCASRAAQPASGEICGLTRRTDLVQRVLLLRPSDAGWRW